MKVVRVPVDIEVGTFWKLAAIAESHDMKVPEFLADLAVVSSRRRNPMDGDPIVARWREGFTDREIAAELAVTNRVVSDRRQSFGLPANRKSNALIEAQRAGK